MSKLLIAISMITILIPNNTILWDLGVSIKSSDNSENNIIKPLISDTQIIPEYSKNTTIHKFDILSSNLSHDYIIKILYFSDRYAELVQYFDTVFSQQVQVFEDQYTIIYSDALYRLGKYDAAINSINQVSSEYPKDEKYFMLALYNKKIGNMNQVTTYLNNLIAECPDSEYYKLAKLQIKITQ